MRLYVLIIVMMVLSGCETVQQNIRDYQNAPKYHKEFRPIQGELNQTNLHQANLVCSSEAQMYAQQQDYQAEQNYIAGQTSDTSYSCKARSRIGSSDTIEAECEPNTSLFSPSQNYRRLQNADETWGNSIKQTAFKIKMTSCMAQRGYSLQQVCFRNCDSL